MLGTFKSTAVTPVTRVSPRGSKSETTSVALEELKVIPVTVVVRSRPLVRRETNEGAKIVVHFSKAQNQVSLPDVNKCFTYDHVFPPDSKQDEVYEKCGRKLIQTIFKGYNATILAYGQTGSGKTFTMGTAHSETVCTDNQKGIIPRVVADIFKLTALKNETHICTIRVSFLEIYNESIYDLFNPSGVKEVHIREDFTGIKISGVKELSVECEKDVLTLLERGTANRKTGSTNMNESSSRSHAIFTLTMEQRSKADTDDCSTSKFHLVDLAGSERAKKTGASGTRFREGVNINKGLLALGNVISALCDGNSHIPYRDSKLTRLLQDSLGGNSYTVMVACVSPADSNLEETLNTLRYADRARKIKNKPIVNKDPRILEIEELKKQITTLQIEWSRHRAKCPLKDEPVKVKDGGDEGEEGSSDDLDVSIAYDTLSVPPACDSYDGNSPVSRHDATNSRLKKQLDKLEEEKRKVEEELQRSMNQIAGFCGRMICAENTRDNMRRQFKEFAKHYEETIKEVGGVNEDAVKAIKMKLAPIIDETLNIVNERTPNPKRNPSELVLASSGDQESDMKRLEATVAISKELQSVEDNIEKKQMLLLHYQNSNDQREEKTEEENARVEQLQSEINRLEKERLVEISIEVPSTTKNAAAKMSEERRKKIKALESEMTVLKKEMAEKTRLLSMKREQERRMKELEKEIKELKSTRVSLMRKMQEESKRIAELQRKVKTQDVRFQNEQHKNKMLVNKNKEEMAQVMRKLKAAQSAKQKLEMSLAKQTALAKDRATFRGKSQANLSERVKDWLNQEIDVEVNRVEARKHIEVLKENRAELAKELENLQEQLEDLSQSPSKKRISGNTTFNLDEVDSSDTLKKRLEIEQDISRIKQSMEEFTSSIQAIHHDMLTGSDDLTLNEKSRWNELSKVAEFKCALSYLFEMLLQQISKNNDVTRDYHEARSSLEQIRKELRDCDREMKKAAQESRETIKKLTDDYNVQMMYLLDQVSGVKKSSDSLGECDLISKLTQNLKEKANEVDQLQAELVLAKNKQSEDVVPQTPSPQPVKNKKGRQRKVTDLDESYEHLDIDTEEDDDDDDFESDPLWEKTPAQNRRTRRRTHMGNKQNSNKENTSNNSEEGAAQKNLKRSTSGTFCSCKGNCITKHCGCRKNNRFCLGNCKCGVDCLNKNNVSDDDDSKSSDGVENTTFMKPNCNETILHETNRKRSPRHLSIPIGRTPTPIPVLDITRTKKDNSFFAPIGPR